MQVTPIVLCFVLMSIVQAAFVTRIPKPKLNLVHSQNLQSSEMLKHKSPQERHKLLLFPNNYMTYLILSEPIYKILTRKPMYEKNNDVNSKADTVLVSEQIILEIVEDKPEESHEKQNDNSEEEDKLHNDSNEIKTGTADTENKESPNLKDLIYPPIAKPIAVTPENKNIQGFSDVLDSGKNSKEIETPDWTEFIFIDPEHKRTESDKISSEEPEEYVTTEFYDDPEIVRRKRGSNVIEEENLASTVAGYKYTGKDTRLNNDVAFKNIHS